MTLKLWSLRSCSPSRSSTSLSFRRARSPWSRLFSRPQRFPSCCSISGGRCPCCAGRAGSFPRRGAEAVSYDPDGLSDHRHSPVAEHGGSCPCCAGGAGSLPCRDAEAVSHGLACLADHRDFAVAVRAGWSILQLFGSSKSREACSGCVGKAVCTGTRPWLTPAIRAGKGWRGRRELAPRCSATQLAARRNEPGQTRRFH